MTKDLILIYLVNTLAVLKTLIVYAIFGRIIFSFLSMGNPYQQKGKITQFLHDVTDPVLNLAKKLPHRISMFDFSPIIAIFGIEIIFKLLTDLIFYI
ncbi:MAG: YggT family protein [Candidatus Gracilibacteria bacterium]|jgi:uncharacterized protein YggT (Ycf19 family)